MNFLSCVNVANRKLCEENHVNGHTVTRHNMTPLKVLSCTVHDRGRNVANCAKLLK